ncbi:MAG: hypothetical protein U9O86_05235 [Campylobacterota bacterium]|nr:hypothetical protein [Campylobacterota bacterium]
MIKSKFKTVIFGAILAASSLAADISEYEFNSSSLVGIEGGIDALNYEYGVRTNNTINNTWLGHAGLKIGAESKDFRVFVSGRYFYDNESKHDYIVTYGAEIQYKFNISKVFNAYMGANAGIANMAFRADKENFTRTISDPYFGGDLGINIHLGKSVDWELGGRVMSIQADNTREGKTYHVNQIVSAYTSIIFKWQMD